MYLIANQADQTWQFPVAAKNFDQILRHQPQNMNLVLRAMLSHILSGNYAVANQYADKFMHHGPNLHRNQLSGQMAFLFKTLHAVGAGRYEKGLETISHLQDRPNYRMIAPITQAWLYAGLKGGMMRTTLCNYYQKTKG